MSKSGIEKIKGIHTVVRSDRNVVAYGKKLYVATLAGEVIFCRNDIRNIFKIAFLPNNLLLVDSGKNYHLISLEDGSDIWKIEQSKREFNAPRFALSPCGTYVYDFCLYKGMYRLKKIYLETALIEEYLMDNELRTANDIQCELDGEPALLRSHYSDIAGVRVSENGVIFPCREPFGSGSSYYWKNKWRFQGSQISYAFWESTETVLTNDLHIFHHATGEMQDLLENEDGWSPPAVAPSSFSIDHSGQFLVLMYSKSNVIIDLNKRRVIAQYAGDYTRGCIVDDEFWISSDSGILRKSFPLMEEIPEMKYVFWNNV